MRYICFYVITITHHLLSQLLLVINLYFKVTCSVFIDVSYKTLHTNKGRIYRCKVTAPDVLLTI